MNFRPAQVNAVLFVKSEGLYCRVSFFLFGHVIVMEIVLAYDSFLLFPFHFDFTNTDYSDLTYQHHIL